MDRGNRHYKPPSSESTFSFPLLKPSELIPCMTDFGLALAEEDLTKPTQARILAIYDHITHTLLNRTREHYSQISFDAMQILEQPELQQESITLVSYYRALRRLMSEIGVDDFSMRDILRPEPPRIRKILSAVVNFGKFREERLGVYEKCTVRGEEIIQRKQALEDQNRQLADKVNTLRQQRAEQEPAAQKLRDANSELTADLRQLQKKQTGLTSEAEALKKEKTELAEKLSKMQMTIMNLKQDCVRLKSRIVQSPEKLKASIAEMNNSLQGDKNTVASIQKRSRELQLKVDLMNMVEQDIDACLKLMAECEAEKNKAEQAARKVVSDKENIEKRRGEIRELDFREDQMKRQITGAHEKLTRLQKHQSVKKDAMSAKLTKLKHEFDAANVERTHCATATDENTRIVIEMEEKIAELRRQESVDAAGLEDIIERISSKFEMYQTSIEKVMITSR
ncbi:Nuf2 family-domain-containing protein [Fimicolochytrium jonesii]|uniref:Nuf2 family-domain-containing protein n=1 Tax=Fimicolochytrium jonesii TaxID=1396493 RepID=UPI0022FE0E68|nr:Nuf2 family-domain-containing protein [Fimicolochytrium jonesii]KAI8821768.1 Nuf2 family-domain-containing protein [Fimicolochytrium jonesii]